VATYFTLLSGINEPEMVPPKGGQSGASEPAMESSEAAELRFTPPELIAAALFKEDPRAHGPAVEGVFESASLTLGAFDLVVSYQADTAEAAAAVSVALSKLFGGTATTLTVLGTDAQAQSPFETGLRVANNLQASGHDGVERRLGAAPSAEA
jgi:hypothetical protein